MQLTWNRDSGAVLLKHVGSGEVRRPVWPPGYSAVAVGGALRLISSGQIVASEGEVFETMDVCGQADGTVLVNSFTIRGAGN